MPRDPASPEPTLAAMPSASPTLAVDPHDASRADEHEETIAGALTSPRAPDQPLATGDRLGRYVISDRLGAGGMGAVYAAHDPDLDRRVAIKVLHAGLAVSDATGGPQRLLREAQAMARLSHPNVLSVFDVGVVGTRLFIAMEMIEGCDLRQWLAMKRRSWKAILEVYVAAGAGLAAAHDAGIIHRDFKPDNVLCANNGRILVGDFGLAAAAADTPPRERTPAHSWLESSGTLTMPGALMGTPAYMAPEQMAAGEITPAVDTFAFCVALHEAVYGRRPFRGDTVANLYVAIAQDRRDTPTGVKLPRRLAAAIARGLAFEPGERPPTMHALLAELRPLLVSRRKLWLGAAALVTVTAAASAGLYAASAGAARCTGGEEALAAVWNPARRDQLGAAFVATGLVYAGDTWTRVAADIDERAAAWPLARRDACEATQVRGEQSDTVLDQRMACLDRQLGELDRTLTFLGEPDPKIIDNAVALLSDLRRPSECEAAALLSQAAAPTLTPEQAAIDVRITHASRLKRVGRSDEALAELTAVLEQLREQDAPRLLARALAVRANLGYLENRTESAAWAAEALEVALRSGSDKHFAGVAAEQIGLAGADTAARDLWLRLGEAAIVRAGGDDDLRAKLLTNYGNALRSEGKLQAAEAAHREVLELRRRDPDDQLGLGDALYNLWADVATQDRGSEAIALANEAIDLWTRELGPNHPRMVTALSGLAILAKREADYDAALTYGRQALERAVLIRGEDHPEVAHCRVVLASIEVWRGDFDAAREHYARALAILAAASTTRPERHVLALLNMASFQADAGELDAAEATLARAAALPAKFPKKHVFWLGDPMTRLQVAVARRDVPAAERELARAREILAATTTTEKLTELTLALNTAELELLRGKTTEGLALIEPLAARFPGELRHPYNRATHDFLKARLLWPAGRHADAHAAAESARAAFASLGPGYAPRVATITAWLAEHPAP